MRAPDSDHPDPEDLPLLTESARVTGVEAMDDNRVDELLDAFPALLRGHLTVEPSPHQDGRQWLRERIEQEKLLDAVDDHAPDRVVDAVDTLASRYRRAYPSLVRVDLETEEPVDFVPGQYLSLRYEETTRPYSVASPPESTDIEFCVRRVPGGELTPDLTTKLEPGDEAVLRGPYGDFVMEDPSQSDLVFLATGTGVAPLRSMIEHVFDSGQDEVDDTERDVWLVLGSGWEDDLAYDELFRSLADDNENFHYVPTLSREEYLTDWTGETAYVQYAFTKYLDPGVVDRSELPEAFHEYFEAEPAYDVDARIDPSNAEVYACGITAMVNSLVDAAQKVGVPERDIHSEGFG